MVPARSKAFMLPVVLLIVTLVSSSAGYAQQVCNVISPSRFGVGSIPNSSSFQAVAERRQPSGSQIIVKLRKGARINVMAQAKRMLGPGQAIIMEQPLRLAGGNYRILRVINTSNMSSVRWKNQLDEVLEKMNAHPDIEYCQYNGRMSAFSDSWYQRERQNNSLSFGAPAAPGSTTGGQALFQAALPVVPQQNRPTDPCYNLQWHYWGNGVGAGQVQGGIDLPRAWKITTGSPDIVVAVVDSGQHFGHADLNRDNLVAGYDFVDNDNDPTDPGPRRLVQGSGFHGTHVSGTIGTLRANNGQGGVSAAWRTRIQPVRVLDGDGSGSDLSVALGIMWAAGVPVANTPVNQTPAKIINLSLGSAKSCTPAQSGIILDAIRAAQARGVLIVAAAGNDNANAARFSPASCPGVLAVGATGLTGARTGYSNWGRRVDVSAPGGESRVDANRDGFPDGVLSSYPGGFLFQPGTSMAAPHVSAVASLIYAVRPQASAAEVTQLIKSTASPANCDRPCGTGIVNAGRAVEAALNVGTAKVGVTTGNLPSDFGFGLETNRRQKETRRRPPAAATGQVPGQSHARRKPRARPKWNPFELFD